MTKFYMYQNDQGQLQTAEGPNPPSEFTAAKNRPWNWTPQTKAPDLAPRVVMNKDMVQPPAIEGLSPQPQQQINTRQKYYNEYMSTVPKPQLSSPLDFKDYGDKMFSLAEKQNKAIQGAYGAQKRKALDYANSQYTFEKNLDQMNKQEARAQKEYDIKIKRLETLGPIEQEQAKSTLETSKVQLENLKKQREDLLSTNEQNKLITTAYLSAMASPDKIGTFAQTASSVLQNPNVTIDAIANINSVVKELSKDKDPVSMSNRIAVLKMTRDPLEAKVKAMNDTLGHLMSAESKKEQLVVMDKSGKWIPNNASNLQQVTFANDINRTIKEGQAAERMLTRPEYQATNLFEQPQQPQDFSQRDVSNAFGSTQKGSMVGSQDLSQLMPVMGTQGQMVAQPVQSPQPQQSITQPQTNNEYNTDLQGMMQDPRFKKLEAPKQQLLIQQLKARHGIQ